MKRDKRQELGLEEIKFRGSNSPDLRVMAIAVINIIVEFGSNSNSRKQQSMDIQQGDTKSGMPVKDSIDVDES